MKAHVEDLSEFDWNFDAVPDEELIACCYWEYARESAFIRALRERCMKEKRADGDRDKELHQDLQRVQSIGYPAWMFLHGFFCPPDGVLPDAILLPPDEVHRLTGSFPKAWQLLTREEREYRAFIPPRGAEGCVQIVPFKRGLLLDAKELVKIVTSLRRLEGEANEEVRRENPKLNDDVLIRLGKLKFTDIPASVIYESGTETTIADIAWGIFTNEEIVQGFRKWVKENRPKDIPGPNDKGRKARDWRVALERLGMMRLLHIYPLSEMEAACAEGWKLYRRREWYKERRRGGEVFRGLFPFLSKTDRPLSWATKGGRSR